MRLQCVIGFGKHEIRNANLMPGVDERGESVIDFLGECLGFADQKS